MRTAILLFLSIMGCGPYPVCPPGTIADCAGASGGGHQLTCYCDLPDMPQPPRPLRDLAESDDAAVADLSEPSDLIEATDAGAD